MLKKITTDYLKDDQLSETLLGRELIVTDRNQIAAGLNGKSVLVTGAAGSIGSEIVRLLASFNLSQLILCDCAESFLYELHLAIKFKYPEQLPVACVCDIRNRNRMAAIFAQYKPEYVFHVAAYKHVPLMEEYPEEAVLTNIMGTKNIADLSILHAVSTFVMVSTDKAVNPGNVMGATKRVAEMYIQSLYKNLTQQILPNENRTKFITTRFGNVLGSNGSVLSLFKGQIANGGPVTVTHPDIIRYFMTIPEACSLVLEAGVMGKGSEVFVFDMGKPVKIMDLAKQMIRHAGFVPEKDIKIELVGLRPGEKLYEELLTQKERITLTNHKKIRIAEVEEFDSDFVGKAIDLVIDMATKMQTPLDIVRQLKAIVPEFISCNSKFEEIDKERFKT